MPHQRGQVVRGPFPRWLLPCTDIRIGKDRTGPDLDERTLFVSMSPKCSMLPNHAISSDKSIRFNPLDATRPLTIRSWPEALNANARKRPPTFRLQGNVIGGFHLRALDRSLAPNTLLDC